MKRVTITAVFDVNEAEVQHWEGSDLMLVGSQIDSYGPEYDVTQQFISSEITVTDPPREWKFGDVVTAEDHPEGKYTVVSEHGAPIYDPDWRDLTGRFRLVAIDGKVLD